MSPLWFKRKNYGWGWYPATWQGWGVIVVYVVVITLLSLGLNKDSLPQELVWYFTKVILLTGLLIFVSYKTGESPKWQWGKKRKS